MSEPSATASLRPSGAWFDGLALAALASPVLVAALVTVDIRGFMQMPALATALTTLALPYLGLALAAALRSRPAGRLALLLSLPVLLTAAATLVVAGRQAVGILAYFAPAIGVVTLVLFLTQLGLAFGGIAIVRGVHAGGRVFTAATGLALAVGILACVDHGSRWLGSSERRGMLALGQGIDARTAVLQTHRCLRLHHRARGRYPDTLEALGPSGDACLPGTVNPGFTLAYTHDDQSFELRAVTADPRTRESYSVMSDESGAIFAGTQRRDGAEPLPGMVHEVIAVIDLCLEQYRLAHPARGYPTSLAAPDREGFECFVRSGLGERMRSVVEIGEAEGYVYRYTPASPDTQGRVPSFRLDARPVVYGRAFRRSWLCTPDGTLHATDENRSAERSDPDEQIDPVTGAAQRSHCGGPEIPARFAVAR